MIPIDETRRQASRLGVPESQIVHDHAISHVLDALSRCGVDGVLFVGGTALCRTWCADTRLSEDVDLLVDELDRASRDLPELLLRELRREFPEARANDRGGRDRVQTIELTLGDRVRLQVQLVERRPEWDQLSTTETRVRLRYPDVPANAMLRVSTPTAFVVMKLLAWADRRTPRDLFDLWNLARGGHSTPDVLSATRAIAGWTPDRRTLGRRVPPRVRRAWHSELGHQVQDPPFPDTCFAVVAAELERLHSSGP